MEKSQKTNYCAATSCEFIVGTLQVTTSSVFARRPKTKTKTGNQIY